MHQVRRPAGLQRDHPHRFIQAASGGFQGLSRHLRPTPLEFRQQRVKTIPELVSRRPRPRCRLLKSWLVVSSAGDGAELIVLISCRRLGMVLGRRNPDAALRRSGTHRCPDDLRGCHLDLLLEDGEHCRTWRLDHWPQLDGDALTATPLPPHRLVWLERQSAAVSGGRGWARRLASGHYAGELPKDPNTPSKLP